MNNGPLKKVLKKLKFNESTISMVLGALVVIVVGSLVINYFRSSSRLSKQPETIPPTSEITETGELPTTYKVVKGDSLWKIAEKLYGSGYNWVDIARENKLINPGLIFSDQELNIPKVEVRMPKTALKPEEIVSRFGEPISGDTYTVVKGDHLWGIAVRAYSDGFQWVKIARENNLVNPNLIYPGNVLKLPR